VLAELVPIECRSISDSYIWLKHLRAITHPVDTRLARGSPWFWTITALVPQYPHDRGYAATREQAMADFEAAWEQASTA
jgi:hypothetical protein